MPPKSSTKEATPSSRRSTRLAPTSVPAGEKQSNGKKVIPTHSCMDGTDKQRSAEEEKESSKKVKVDTSSKDKTASNVKSKKESNVEVEIKQSKAPKAEDEKEKVKPKPKSSSNSKLQKGDNLPSIKLENEDGEEIDVSTLTGGGKGVVIFVYPKVSSILFNEIFELMQFFPLRCQFSPHPILTFESIYSLIISKYMAYAHPLAFNNRSHVLDISQFPIVSRPHQHDCLRNQADTPGCTNQACGFRDHLSEIKALGYDIYGLSKDKPAALKRVCPLVLLLLLICLIRT